MELIKRIPWRALSSFGLFIMLAFSATALLVNLISTPSYAQTTNAWNIHRQGAGNDLNFYYNNGSNLPTALQLNTNGEMRARKIWDLDASSYFIDPSNSTTSLTVAGNVGIGITSPSYPLQVSSGFAKTDTTSRLLGMFGSNEGAASWGLKMAITGAATSANSTLNLQTGDNATNIGNLNLQSWGGNVGIGTTAPTKPLQIVSPNATTGVAIGKNDALNLLLLGYDNSTNVGTIGSYAGGAASTLAINPSGGNVGIGTASPTTPLEIWYNTPTPNVHGLQVINKNTTAGRTGELTLGVFDGGNYLRTKIYHSSDSPYGWNDQRLTIATQTTGADAYIDTASFKNGKVGLGINSPAARLSILGSNNTNDAFRVYNAAQNAWSAIYSDASGNAYFQIQNGAYCIFSTGGVWTCYASDQRLKENIRHSSKGLNDLLHIQVSDFNFKKQPGKTQTGFIAQQLEPIFPEAVVVPSDLNDPEHHPYMVDYGRITPLIVKSVQELDQKVENQQIEIDELKKEIAGLKSLHE